jgi:hypothetical protein
MLIRAADATHVYDGLDLSRLSGTLKPSAVVTAADLARVGVRVPEFYAGDFLCPVGKTPLYLGQPVALLIFADFDAFDQARLTLRDQAVLKFGKETGPVTMPSYGAFRFTRLGGATPDAPDVDQGGTQVTVLAVTINGRAYGPRDVRDELSMNDFLLGAVEDWTIRLRRDLNTGGRCGLR